MKTAANTILSWNTKKEADGTFTASVVEIGGFYADDEWVGTHSTVKRVSGWKTRAKARANAIAWMRFIAAKMDEAAVA